MPLEANSLGEQTQQGQQQQGQQSQGGDQTQSKGGDQEAQGGASGQQAATRPEWLPENFWDAEKSAIKEDFGAHFNELSTLKQAEADRLKAMPEKPEAYELAIPEDLELPEGVSREDIAVAKDDPFYAQAQKLFFDARIPPEIGNKLYGLYVQKQVADVGAINQAVAAEKQKLGTNYKQRYDAAATFVNGRVGKELGGALMKAVVTADAVKALEKLATVFASQGAPPVPPGGNEGEPNGKIPGYETMSFEEKRLHQQKRAAAG